MEFREPMELQKKHVQSHSDTEKIANGDEPTRSCNGNGNRYVIHIFFQAQGIQEKQGPIQKQPNAAASEENLNSNISLAEDKGSSFFHFGSLFALADASKSDSLPSECSVESNSSVKFIHWSKRDFTRNTRGLFEEYNLFAINKGITFYIFSKNDQGQDSIRPVTLQSHFILSKVINV